MAKLSIAGGIEQQTASAILAAQWEARVTELAARIQGAPAAKPSGYVQHAPLTASDTLRYADELRIADMASAVAAGEERDTLIAGM